MPALLLADLSNVRPSSNKSATATYLASLRGKNGILKTVFNKDEKLSDEQVSTRSARLVTEWVSARLAQRINERMGSPLTIPDYELVVDESGQVIGLWCNEISISSFDDRPFHFQRNQSLLRGIAIHTGIRMAMGDPDGHGNQFHDDTNGLSLAVIDFGLSLYAEVLEKIGALVSDIEREITEDVSIDLPVDIHIFSRLFSSDALMPCFATAFNPKFWTELQKLEDQVHPFFENLIAALRVHTEVIFDAVFMGSLEEESTGAKASALISQAVEGHQMRARAFETILTAPLELVAKAPHEACMNALSLAFSQKPEVGGPVVSGGASAGVSDFTPARRTSTGSSVFSFFTPAAGESRQRLNTDPALSSPPLLTRGGSTSPQSGLFGPELIPPSTPGFMPAGSPLTPDDLLSESMSSAATGQSDGPKR